MGDASVFPKVDMEKTVSVEEKVDNTLTSEVPEGNAHDILVNEQGKEIPVERHVINSLSENNEASISSLLKDKCEKDSSEEENVNSPHDENLEKKTVEERKETLESLEELESLNINGKAIEAGSESTVNILDEKELEVTETDAGRPERTTRYLEEILYGDEPEPVFDGTEGPVMESVRSSLDGSMDNEPETRGYAWPEKAVAVKNFVREKSLFAVSSFLRRLSGKSNEGQDGLDDGRENNISSIHGKGFRNIENEADERSGWHPLDLIKISHDFGVENKDELEDEEDVIEPLAMKGRILLYTRLRCQECKETRLFLHRKRLRYIEINIDVYPGRKLELQKLAGSSAVPRVFFNEVRIGGLSELKNLDESGKLMEKIEYVVSEAPSFEAPLPPLSGEDDLSSSGSIDELALIVRKMKDNIVVKDRFYKMRHFTNSFLGSEVVDFLSEDQYLEREEVSYFSI